MEERDGEDRVVSSRKRGYNRLSSSEPEAVVPPSPAGEKIGTPWNENSFPGGSADFTPRDSHAYLNLPPARTEDGSADIEAEARPESKVVPEQLLGSRDLRSWEVMVLTCFNFPYGFIVGTMGLYVLPAEALRLYEARQSIALGISLGLVGTTQLVCPIAGKLSDALAAASPLDRRKPFIVWGAVVACASTLGMWLTSLWMWGVLYYFNLFTGMVALNVVYSVQGGLVPDVVDDDSTGTASGIVAVHSVVGSAIGFVVVIATSGSDFHLCYPMYVVLSAVTVISSLCMARRLESRLTRNRMQQHAAGSSIQLTSVRVKSDSVDANDLSPPSPSLPVALDVSHAELTIPPLERPRRFCGKKFMGVKLEDLARSYVIDTSQSWDFFWVFVGRTFYYVGVSVQAFILFYLRDVVGTSSESTRRMQIGSIALVAQGTAAAVAYPMGKCSDRSSVGKKPLIYLACAIMSLTYIGFMSAPVFGVYAFPFVLAVSVLYGAGNGCFLSVDLALALATLPSKAEAARSLGIWGVSAFIGSALGPLLWGLVIEVFGSNPDFVAPERRPTPIPGALTSLEDRQYLYPGYFAMLVGGIVATWAAGFVIRLVKATN